jgi:hypothetical protein
MSGAAALDLARDAEPVDVDGSSVTGAGYAPGDTVTIVADDYGQETTSGTVIRVLQNEVTVNRTDAAVGTVAVHYPRAGYRVTKSG